MEALRLTAKIRLAIVRLEEGADCSVGVEGDKGARGAVVARGGAVSAPDFLDGPAHGCIAQCLRRAQVLLFRHRRKVGTMPGEMLAKLAAGMKADTGSARARGHRR